MTSLQRPVLPLKLDLSSASLRMGVEETTIFSSSGLHSPITLAPKSARPNDYPNGMLGNFPTNDESSERVDIDLTLEDDIDMGLNLNPTQLGSSADQPIDIDGIDIDIGMSMDLFGDPVAENSSNNGGVDDLFTPDISPDGLTGDNMDTSSAAKASNDFLMSFGVSEQTQVEGGDFLAGLVGPTDSTTKVDENTTSGTDFMANFDDNSNAGDATSSQFDLPLDIDFFGQDSGLSLLPDVSNPMQEILDMEANQTQKAVGTNAETKES
jgi:hypothetical protein